MKRCLYKLVGGHFMEDIIKSFTEKNNLWERAKSSGLSCLKNYIDEGTAQEIVDIAGLTADKFIFTKKDQELISFNQTDQSFILRTTFVLETRLANNKKILGHYSLDVDNNAVIIDDWLVFK